MNDSITFFVPGQPVGKGRPRFARAGNFVQTFTPDKTVSYEEKIRGYAIRAGVKRFEAEHKVSIAIKAFREIPGSWPKKEREAAVMTACDAGPDADNIAKIVCDALNGVAWKDDRQVVALGVAHDLESNVAVSTEVRRRITDKYGKRFSDDMIQVTANAACALAMRNAILKAIPMALAKSVLEAAKKVAVGDAKSLGERRQLMISAFAKIHVTPDQILRHVGKETIEEIGLVEIEDLLGVFTAIKEGESNIEEQFPPVRPVKPDDAGASAPPPAPPTTSAAAPAGDDHGNGSNGNGRKNGVAYAAAALSPKQKYNAAMARAKKFLTKEELDHFIAEHSERHEREIRYEDFAAEVDAYIAANTPPDAKGGEA